MLPLPRSIPLPKQPHKVLTIMRRLCRPANPDDTPDAGVAGQAVGTSRGHPLERKPHAQPVGEPESADSEVT